MYPRENFSQRMSGRGAEGQSSANLPDRFFRNGIDAVQQACFATLSLCFFATLPSNGIKAVRQACLSPLSLCPFFFYLKSAIPTAIPGQANYLE